MVWCILSFNTDLGESLSVIVYEGIDESVEAIDASQVSQLYTCTATYESMKFRL